MYMARRYSETVEELANTGLDDKERSALLTKRDAYLKNIQNSDFKKLIATND